MNTRYDDMYQAASRYYVQGETMDAIAKQLGLSRSSVSRLLKEARETGLVRISLADTSDATAARIAAIPGTGSLARDGDTVVITTDDASTFVPRLFEAAPGTIRSVTIGTASLEDAYFQHVRRRSEGAAK